MVRSSLIPVRGSHILNDLAILRDEFFFPVQETFDRFFQEFFGSDNLFDSVKGKSGYPKMEVGTEVVGTGDAAKNFWTVRVALPGVQEKDVVIEVDESNKNVPILRIQGQMSEEYQSPEGSEHYVRELRKGKFAREVALPKSLTGEPEAVMKDGILTLRWNLPKAVTEEPKPTIKKIELKK